VEGGKQLSRVNRKDMDGYIMDSIIGGDGGKAEIVKRVAVHFYSCVEGGSKETKVGDIAGGGGGGSCKNRNSAVGIDGNRKGFRDFRVNSFEGPSECEREGGSQFLSIGKFSWVFLVAKNRL
jgi:hypothetical protein